MLFYEGTSLKGSKVNVGEETPVVSLAKTNAAHRSECIKLGMIVVDFPLNEHLVIAIALKVKDKFAVFISPRDPDRYDHTLGVFLRNGNGHNLSSSHELVPPSYKLHISREDLDLA